MRQIVSLSPSVNAKNILATRTRTPGCPGTWTFSPAHADHARVDDRQANQWPRPPTHVAALRSGCGESGQTIDTSYAPQVREVAAHSTCQPGRPRPNLDSQEGRPAARKPPKGQAGPSCRPAWVTATLGGQLRSSRHAGLDTVPNSGSADRLKYVSRRPHTATAVGGACWTRRSSAPPLTAK
jgi:hypothetical protein